MQDDRARGSVVLPMPPWVPTTWGAGFFPTSRGLVIPLAFWLGLTCADLHQAELSLATHEFVVLDRLENPKSEEQWVRSAWEDDLLLTIATLDDVDTAKKKLNCEAVP